MGSFPSRIHKGNRLQASEPRCWDKEGRKRPGSKALSSSCLGPAQLAGTTCAPADPWCNWIFVNVSYPCLYWVISFSLFIYRNPLYCKCFSVFIICHSFFLKIFIDLFLAVLGLQCWAGFPGCRRVGGSYSLSVVPSHVLAPGCRAHGLSSCSTQDLLPCDMWDVPRTGIEPVSPALASGFLTMGPPGKPYLSIFSFKVPRFVVNLRNALTIPKFMYTYIFF